MTIALRLMRDRRRSTAYWTIGVLAYLLLQLAFYPALREQPALDDALEDLPEGVQKLIGTSGLPLTEPEGFLHAQVFTTTLPLVLLVFGIALGARAIAGSEEEGTLEVLLANPVSRARVAIERYVGILALIVILGAATTLGTIAISAPFQLLEGVSILNLVVAGAAVTFFVILHASIAFVVGAALGGRAMAISAAAAIAVGGYVLFGLVSSAVVSGARFVTPWYWYLNRNIVAQGAGAESLLLPIAVSAVLAALGVWRFGLRDLR